MPAGIQVSALVMVIGVLWAISLIMQGIDVRPELFKPFTNIGGAVVLVLAIFDHWLWRVPILQGWFVKRPDLRGTWRASFQTSWRNPETGEIPGPMTGFMVVRQTYCDITMRLFTKESSSHFVADELSRSHPMANPLCLPCTKMSRRPKFAIAARSIMAR